MVPLALLGGEGVELRRALAVAVIGGLVTSFFAALFLVPVLHRALTGRRGGG
jgi:multidrug efflux pump subunit AcrB